MEKTSAPSVYFTDMVVGFYKLPQKALLIALALAFFVFILHEEFAAFRSNLKTSISGAAG